MDEVQAVLRFTLLCRCEMHGYEKCSSIAPQTGLQLCYSLIEQSSSRCDQIDPDGADAVNDDANVWAWVTSRSRKINRCLDHRQKI